MVVFRVTENINIKITDGTLVKYQKVKKASDLLNETIYITTFEDFNDIKRVFKSVNSKYKAKTIDEAKVRYLSQFPKELGITNINEYNITNNLNYKYKDKIIIQSESNPIESIYLNEEKVNLEKQIAGVLKRDIKIAILGNLGSSISEMICACTALRLFYEKLLKEFKSVTLDIYLNASENRFYSRDKMIFQTQTFVNKVSALSINVKSFCEYDFFVDTSSVNKRSFYQVLNYTDAWLYKFGIDYKKISQKEKYNEINIMSFKPRNEFKEKLHNLKQKSKLLFFHPFSANIEKSIPKEFAIKFLKKIIKEMPEYIIVSSLKIDSKFIHNRFVDLSNESKSILDFFYIVSNCQKVLTVDTSTYYIADAFFIPTVVILTEESKKRKINNYEFSKAVYVEDKSKNFSQFIFKNENLILHTFDGWKQFNINKVIKLLDKL